MAERNGKRWPASADTRNDSWPGDESQIEDQDLAHESDWEEGRRGKETQRERDSLYTNRVRPQSLTSLGTNDRSDMGK